MRNNTNGRGCGDKVRLSDAKLRLLMLRREGKRCGWLHNPRRNRRCTCGSRGNLQRCSTAG